MQNESAVYVQIRQRILLKKRLSAAAVSSLLLCMALFSAGCPSGTKKLATASSTVAHALENAQQAVAIGVSDGVVSPKDAETFNTYLVKVSEAGLVLDQGIRANESATNISGKVNSFMDSFNALNTQGLLYIKNPKVQLAVSTAITGAEAAVAIIAATAGK